MNVLVHHLFEVERLDHVVGLGRIGEDLLPSRHVIIHHHLRPFPAIGLAFAGDRSRQRPARLAGVIGIEHKRVRPELLTQVITDAFKEALALAKPPGVILLAAVPCPTADASE